MAETSTLDTSQADDAAGDGRAGGVARALVIAWSAAHGGRVGEALVLVDRGRTYLFGRGGEREDDAHPRRPLVRQRPESRERTPPYEDAFLSRAQIAVRATDDGVEVENLGKRSILVDGVEVGGGTAHVGGTLELKNRLLFVCVDRPAAYRPLRSWSVSRAHPFGAPDAHGMVGESAPAWALRDEIAFVARRAGHVLLTGESGSGKELVAQAIHALSPRRSKKLVARNAATFPAGLIDAELFGNVANYPNAGMPERPGLVGEADGSTLLLDEIGELPLELQAHLLRLLDAGEYQRLGDARRRRADVRLVAATNRDVDELKHDLGARLVLRLAVPGLNDRREDVPLVARHLLRTIAAREPDVGERYFEGWDGTSGEPRLAPALVRALVTHRYRTHVRELERLLWTALRTSEGGVVELTDAVGRELDAAPKPQAPARTSEITAEQVRAALAKHGGKRELVWRELGLANRHVLKRLVKRFGIADDE